MAYLKYLLRDENDMPYDLSNSWEGLGRLIIIYDRLHEDFCEKFSLTLVLFHLFVMVKLKALYSVPRLQTKVCTSTCITTNGIAYIIGITAPRTQLQICIKFENNSVHCTEIEVWALLGWRPWLSYWIGPNTLENNRNSLL